MRMTVYKPNYRYHAFPALWDSFFNEFIEDERKELIGKSTVWNGLAFDESDKHLQLNVDLPGVKKEDIDVSLNQSILKIKATREFESKGEKSVSEFNRSFTIPEGVNSEALEATFENGVLTLVLPKEEKAPEKKIEVKSGKSSFLQRMLEFNKKDKEH